MAGEGTKQERENPNPNLNQNPNQSPERGQHPGTEEDPSKKRNRPDQYNEHQGGGMPPTEQAGKREGQTGHEDPKTGMPQGGHDRGEGRQDNGGQQRDRNKSNEPDERGVKQGQKH